jgi:hypothetical protein
VTLKKANVHAMPTIAIRGVCINELGNLFNVAMESMSRTVSHGRAAIDVGEVSDFNELGSWS